jgi:hypothetical protein
LRSILATTGNIAQIERYALRSCVIRGKDGAMGIAIKGIDAEANTSIFEERLIDGALPRIEEARRNGAIIINDGSGVGYYTSDDLGEITRQLKMNERRARSVLVQNRHLRRRIKELKSRDQVTLEEVTCG